MRGPLYQGLPTLEEHRGVHPLAGALDLLASNTDIVYIGDAGLSENVQEQFASFQKEQIVLLHTEPVDEEFYEYILGKHTNRQDDARDVIRSADARFREIPSIPARNTATRMKGSITLDNEKYLRYMGEIQLTKYDLPADEKVNVVAKVIKEELPLINQIKAGMNYQFIRKEGR